MTKQLEQKVTFFYKRLGTKYVPVDIVDGLINRQAYWTIDEGRRTTLRAASELHWVTYANMFV